MAHRPVANANADHSQHLIQHQHHHHHQHRRSRPNRSRQSSSLTGMKVIHEEEQQHQVLLVHKQPRHDDEYECQSSELDKEDAQNVVDHTTMLPATAAATMTATAVPTIMTRKMMPAAPPSPSAVEEEMLMIARRLRRAKRSLLLKSVEAPVSPVDKFRSIVLNLSSSQVESRHLPYLPFKPSSSADQV